MAGLILKIPPILPYGQLLYVGLFFWFAVHRWPRKGIQHESKIKNDLKSFQLLMPKNIIIPKNCDYDEAKYCEVIS